ncbi:MULTISPECIES: Scr1 family TA system antitoxin-like transcriptional regulator [Kitasatospora]|uniref:DUF5753 domain-containing protein n=1 Tax=Kitasatospora setae (strain ATCC 33774 / DSM 43861 / JCM 3304 / KCC A-0304 / NBRC 14216 / KM-6054) TaxID=452652 RepID=E4NA70_KITSK|nr:MULTISPECIES: Scr1 family TA system antitoxin-like transcriptional regulator [Kitasatospora]BAJ28101.1 hypothetical protein KSE_22810 [Kitasatospora setae KM-6054]
MAVDTFHSDRGGGAARPWAEAALLLGAHLEVSRGNRTQSEVVAATGKLVSPSYYSRIERGDIRIDKPHLIPLILDAQGIGPGEHRDRLVELAFAASQEGWAARFRSGNRMAVPETMLRLTSLEESATELFVVDRNAIPGQLQTEAYSRLITRYTLPASLQDAGLQEVVVGLRAERRHRFAERLATDRPKARFFIEQSVLHADFGRPEILIDQLQALLDLVEDRSLPVGIRVMTVRIPLAIPINTLTRLGFRRSVADSVPDVIYNELGRQAAFHRGSLPGANEVADPGYVDLNDLIDNVLLRAPGFQESRRLIQNALLEAQLRL